MAVTLAEGTRVGLDVSLEGGKVNVAVTPLKIEIKSFKYNIGGLYGVFVGVVDQSVTDDATNYVYLDNTGTLQLNTTGFPTDISYFPISRVTTSNGEIVAVYDEKVLYGISSAVQGTCRVGFPVDAGVRGGNSGVSSNNSVPSITFDDVGESRNRWNFRPPQNYISGDVTLSLICSVAGSPGSNGMRMGLEWTGESIGDTLPSSYDYSVDQTESLSGISNDENFEMTFTITAANFDITKDYFAFYLKRDGDHGDDTSSLMLHILICELQYTGYKVAGQPGQ